MNNVRRIAVAAVAGAAVSSFVSLHVRIFDRLPYIPGRRKRIADLGEWYEAELHEAELYAVDKSVVFCFEDEARFRETAASVGLTKSATDRAFVQYLEFVCVLMYLHQEVLAARTYTDRLGEIDRNLAHDKNPELVAMMKSENAIVNLLTEMGHPANAVYDWMRKHPRS